MRELGGWTWQKTEKPEGDWGTPKSNNGPKKAEKIDIPSYLKGSGITTVIRSLKKYDMKYQLYIDIIGVCDHYVVSVFVERIIHEYSKNNNNVLTNWLTKNWFQENEIPVRIRRRFCCSRRCFLAGAMAGVQGTYIFFCSDNFIFDVCLYNMLQLSWTMARPTRASWKRRSASRFSKRTSALLKNTIRNSWMENCLTATESINFPTWQLKNLHPVCLK